MCMVRTKQGRKYVRLCAWYTDNLGYPKQAVSVDTDATYRQSVYVYYECQDAPVSRYKGQPWPHFDPAKAGRLSSDPVKTGGFQAEEIL